MHEDFEKNFPILSEALSLINNKWKIKEKKKWDS